MSVTFSQLPLIGGGIPMARIHDEAYNGAFVMGGMDHSLNDAEPHWVTLPRGVEVSLGHVTEDQFRRVMGESQEGRELLADVGRHYVRKEGWSRSLAQEGFEKYPVNCVSWEEQEVFLRILNGLLGITEAENKIRRPTEAEMEFVQRGEWVSLRGQAEKEKVSLDTWGEFLAFVVGRFENMVSDIYLGAEILNVGNEKLRALVEDRKDLWAMRVYGTVSGAMDRSVQWRGPMLKCDGPRESRTLFDELGTLGGIVDVDLVTNEFKHMLEAGMVHSYGITDAIGNVNTWCEDDYERQAYNNRSGIPHPLVKTGNSRNKAVRGGSWSTVTSNEMRVSSRESMGANMRLRSDGFRCARPL